MPTNLPRDMGTGTSQRWRAPPVRAVWTAAYAAVPAVLVLLVLSVSPPLVLPAFAAIAVSAGLALAIGVRLACAAASSARDFGLTLAGGLVFAGFAAAILTDQSELAQAFAAGQP